MHINEVNIAKPSYRQILVGQRPVAIRGLDEIFDELYEHGRQPGDPDLGSELVEQVPGSCSDHGENGPSLSRSSAVADL